jgi:transketolase
MQDQTVINQMKGHIIDAVNKAASGHPGGALSSLDFAYLLFSEFLNYDPDDTSWLGRDRFILSAGHESALLYTLLAYQGFLPFDELKRFRQVGSKTPGHPENVHTPGVECTTGPLGQGAAMSVGFAAAAKHFAAGLDPKLFSQKIWVLMGDGCMQTPVALGAASLAGHYRLSNLIWYYDRNAVQISGKISRATSDNTRKIFEGFGWKTLEIDGHNHEEIRTALTRASRNTGKPLLIIGNTVMANGTASMSGSPKTHGSPLPQDEYVKTKELLGLSPSEEFYVSEECLTHFRRNHDGLRKKVRSWHSLLKKKHKDAAFAQRYASHFINPVTEENTPSLAWDTTKPLATRAAFGKIIHKWCETMPALVGGSGDLEPSNETTGFAQNVGDFQHDSYQNRNFAFGVREFPMTAFVNGLALFGGLKPFVGTFLSFSDYARPALRLGAIQRACAIHEYTHDSFYVGEDGPTHQPVEHIMSLRLIPDLYVMRPADALETEILYRQALSLPTTSIMCLTRQNLPHLTLTAEQKQNVLKGAYNVNEQSDPELIILATGSELHLALKVAGSLQGVKTRVVSMPCWELFEEQDAAYKESVLPRSCSKRVSIEAGSTTGWQKYTGSGGLNIGLDTFGMSGPASELEKRFGFTVENIIQKIQGHTFS